MLLAQLGIIIVNETLWAYGRILILNIELRDFQYLKKHFHRLQPDAELANSPSFNDGSVQSCAFIGREMIYITYTR